jgi:hypothetical protein
MNRRHGASITEIEAPFCSERQMAFNMYADQPPLSGVNAAIVPADPGYIIAMRIRALLTNDPNVRIPMTGLMSPFVRRLEGGLKLQPAKGGTERAVASTAQVEDIVTKQWSAGAIALQGFAERLPTLSDRVLESMDITQKLAAFGIIVEKKTGNLDLGGACILELNATLNMEDAAAAGPLSSLKTTAALDGAANALNGQWFADSQIGSGLSAMAKQFIIILTALRFLTGSANIKLITSLSTERLARAKAAAASLSSLSALLTTISLSARIAELNFIISFITSDPAVDALRDEEGIRLRAALIAEFADLDGLDIIDTATMAKQFYTPFSSDVGGVKTACYRLPPRVYSALRQSMVVSDPNAVTDSDSLPEFSAIVPSIWAVDSPSDELATRSKLHRTQFVTRVAAIAANEMIATYVHAAIKVAREEIRSIKASEMVAMLPGGVNALKAAVGLLPRGGPITRLDGWDPSSSNNNAPVLITGNDSALGATKDIGLLKTRPVAPFVISAVPTTDIAALAGMYSTALERRLSNMDALTARYDRQTHPAVPFLLPTNPDYAKGTWPLAEAAEFYQFWPHCYSQHTPNPIPTLDVYGLTSLMSGVIPGYKAVTILQRDVPAAPEKTAAALCRVGFIIHVTKENTTLKQMVKKVSEGLGLVPAATSDLTPVSIVEPSGSYAIPLGVAQRAWPKDLGGAKVWCRYETASEIERRIAPLSPNGTYWFLPFTHVPVPPSIDGKTLFFSNPKEVQNVNRWLTTRTGYTAHDSEALFRSNFLDGEDNTGTASTVKEANFVPGRNEPWHAPVPGTILPDEVSLDPKADWWPVRGIIRLTKDVRSHWVFTLRAGVRDATDKYILFERSDGKLPKFRAIVPVGAIMMSDDEGMTPTEHQFTPFSAKIGEPIGKDDWIVGYQNPKSITTVDVI